MSFSLYCSFTARVAPLQPCHVIVSWIATRWRVLCRWKFCAVCAGKRAKVIVEAVVLLNDDYNMLDWIVRLHARSECLPGPMQSTTWAWDVGVDWRCRAQQGRWQASSSSARDRLLRWTRAEPIE